MGYDCGHSGFMVRGGGVGTHALITQCCTRGCTWFRIEWIDPETAERELDE